MNKKAHEVQDSILTDLWKFNKLSTGLYLPNEISLE